eukprot:2185704-Alexandrium_andersonii.AAC.1
MQNGALLKSWSLDVNWGPSPLSISAETIRGLAGVAQDLDHLSFGCLNAEGGGGPWRIEADGGGWLRMEEGG